MNTSILVPLVVIILLYRLINTYFVNYYRTIVSPCRSSSYYVEMAVSLLVADDQLIRVDVRGKASWTTQSAVSYMSHPPPYTHNLNGKSSFDMHYIIKMLGQGYLG